MLFRSNPSFTLYDVDNHFHCFACGRHGSVIDLVMLVEGVDFKTALAQLKQHYVLGRADDRPRRVMHTERPSTPHEISEDVKQVMAAATTYYQSALQRHPSALAYLHKRGLTDETLAKLRIGYADGGLGRALFAQGIDLALAAHIGLITSRGEMLRGRAVFPVFDAQARPIWMIARALRDADAPKYLGLPDGLVHKQPMVLGTPKRGTIWVEGAFDVAALVQWGLGADYLIVGLLGTASESVVERVIAQLPPNSLIALDQDLAGKQAALKLATHLREQGLHPAVLVDADRHDRVTACLAHMKTKPQPSDHERERTKLLMGEAEVAITQTLSDQQFSRWVRWGNHHKDPGSLCKLGQPGRTLFLAALARPP